MRRFVRLAWKPLALLVVLAAVGWALRQLGLDALVLRAGEYGPAAFALAGTLACAIGLPRQGVAYAAGLAYGFWPGVLLALLTEVAGCVLDFAAARLLGRSWAARLLSRAAEHGRLARLERLLVANAFSATLTIRLLPLGNNLALNLVAGMSRVAAAPFLLASALGYVPQTVVFVLLGEGVRVSDALSLTLAAAALLASIALGIVLMRRRPGLA